MREVSHTNNCRTYCNLLQVLVPPGGDEPPHVADRRRREMRLAKDFGATHLAVGAGGSTHVFNRVSSLKLS